MALERATYNRHVQAVAPCPQRGIVSYLGVAHNRYNVLYVAIYKP